VQNPGMEFWGLLLLEGYNIEIGRMSNNTIAGSGFRGQKTDGRGQKTDGRGQRTEDRCQRSDDRDQMQEN